MLEFSPTKLPAPSLYCNATVNSNVNIKLICYVHSAEQSGQNMAATLKTDNRYIAVTQVNPY